MVCVVMVCMLLMLQYSHMAHAAVYTVGGAQGWTFNVASWPKGKRFRAGDTLGNFTIFKHLKSHFEKLLNTVLICLNVILLVQLILLRNVFPFQDYPV